MLYGITSQQKDVGKILILKSVSEPVHALIAQIAAYAKDLSEELESMAQRYPALRIDTQFLPEVEVKARESTSSDISHALLNASGKTFERRLLHTQLDALDQERHIARVMVELEESDARRPFWTHAQNRLDELHADVAQLLARECSCR